MKRLVVAAVLAAGVHVVLFRIEVPWIRPVISTPRSRAVDISLVTIAKPAAKTENSASRPESRAEPAPGHAPGPKPNKPPKPVAKQAVQSLPRHRSARPEPAPAAAQPVFTPLPVDAGPAEAPGPLPEAQKQPPSDEEHAAVQVSVPLYNLNPPPVYPRVARRRNYQGTVLLDVRVTVEGKVADVRLARSSGHQILDRSALDAVEKWRFEPARRAGRPVETWVRVPVRFELQ